MMEKIFAFFKLGARYLYRYRRRYGFLLAALSFGFAIVTLITSLKDGMYDNVYYTAQSHYAGDVVAAGYDYYSGEGHHLHMGQNEITAILNAAAGMGIDPSAAVLRTLYGSNSLVIYNGAAVRLKYLIGCDWASGGEARLFDRMVFAEPPAPFSGDNTIVLSAPTAEQLGAKMGDSVTIEVETRWGQKNTATFIITGIVKDTSIFGYLKAYISRTSLNRLILYPDDDCSSIGFFLKSPASAEKVRQHMQAALSEKLAMGPLVNNRAEMDRDESRPGDNRIKVSLYTMPVYLSEISDLLNAMNIITYFLYVMMLLIILVSAAVTYRLILHERTRELGVMRVIGFYGGDLRFVLWTEIAVLGLLSLVTGFILALILSWAVSFLSFSWLPSFEIFMKNGKLTPLYLPGTTLANMATIFLILFAFVVFPSFRVSRKKLPDLLSGEPL